MKTDKISEVTSVSNSEQENFKNPRKTLQALQPSAADKENLVGPGRKFNASHSKDNLIKDANEIYLPDPKILIKRKKLAHKSTQSDTTDTDLSDEDLTNVEASPHYYKVLAERRRVALEETLAENEELYKKINLLDEKVNTLKNMLQQANDLTDLLTEILDEKEEKEKADKSVHYDDSLLD